MKKSAKKSKNLVLSAAIIITLILGFTLLFKGANKPFWGHHDWNSVVYANIARNYIRYGYLGAKFGQVTNADFGPKESRRYITHYPPLLPILISISFKLFAQSEIAARTTVILFSMIFLYSMYKIGEAIHSKLLGLFAALSLALTPIFLYFGKLPVHDTIVPAIFALGFWLYLKFLKTQENKYYFLLVAVLVFSGLVNWSGLYLTLAVIVHQLLIKSRVEARQRLLILVPISILVFLAYVAHIQFLGTGTGKVFSNLFERVNPFLTKDMYGFSVLKYLKQEYLFSKIYYTMPIAVAAFLTLSVSVWKIYKKHTDLASATIVSLFIYGSIQLVIFSQLSFIHDYMIYYLAPFIVLASAYFYFLIFEKHKRSLIFPIVLIIILSLSFLSSLNYTNTLLKTDTNKRAYYVAKIIKNTESGKKSFVASNSYKEFQEVFVTYYSDRIVDYGEELPRNFATSYSLVVRPKDHDPLAQNDKELLDQNFPRFEDNRFIWYLIN